MDLNIYSERLPKPGETVTEGTFKQFLGGKGANQSVAAVRAGAKTIFIGKIGKDAFGDQMMARLTNEGIDMSHVIRDDEVPSGLAFIMIDQNGENMISVAPGANARLKPSEIYSKSEIIKNAKTLVVQMELPIETIETIYNIAVQGNVVKILNPAPLKPIPKSVLRNIDIIIPNEGELLRLHSLLGFKEHKGETKERIVRASKDISSLGVNIIITTLGKKGSLVYKSENGEVIEVPSFKVKVVDTVGAGDCFNGVLACQLCKDETIETAVKYATAAASIAVTRKGAQESMPFLNEIEKRLNEIRQ